MKDDELTQLLFVNDEPRPGDFALVFGHHDQAVSAKRARHAARLYLTGFVPTVLLSGGPLTSPLSEAEMMARVVREEGVPDQNLLLERSSKNTFENVGQSLALLRDRGLLEETATVLLVSCPWHMRRVFLTAQQGFPAETRLLCCPHEESCTEDTWAESAECRTAVLGEWRILSRFVSRGLLPSP